jgi:putative transposase
MAYAAELTTLSGIPIALSPDAMSRPKRLENFPYLGPNRYFLTFCVRDRVPVFRNTTVAEQTLTQFRRTSTLERFAILAYCVMPDHAHLLVDGVSDDSDFKRFAKMAKQRSGGLYARTHHERLWQEGYYERVLREDDDPRALARYIVNNPVRAGLVKTPTEYPLTGSDVWTLAELLESSQ